MIESVGQWYVCVKNEVFRIFPKDKKTGETRCITVARRHIAVVHKKSMIQVVFRYTGRGDYFQWKDTRDNKVVSESYVESEIKRMTGRPASSYLILAKCGV